MRRGSRKMWWVVPCTSRKTLRTESGMDIEEILKMKLATIKEEPETTEENGILTKQRCLSKKGKKIHLKVKMGRLFMPQFSLKESYVLFMTGLATKGEWERTGSPHWQENTIAGYMSSIFSLLTISAYVVAIFLGNTTRENGFQFNFLDRDNLRPLNLPFTFFNQNRRGLATFSSELVSLLYLLVHRPLAINSKPILNSIGVLVNQGLRKLELLQLFGSYIDLLDVLSAWCIYSERRSKELLEREDAELGTWRIASQYNYKRITNSRNS